MTIHPTRAPVCLELGQNCDGDATNPQGVDMTGDHYKYEANFKSDQQAVDKLPTHRHCEEQSDEAIQKPRCNKHKRSCFWRKRRLDCFASLAMTGWESFFNGLLVKNRFCIIVHQA
jgi:hypothetical protein